MTDSENLKYDYSFDTEAQNSTAATIYRLLARGPHNSILDVGSGPAVVSTAFAREFGSSLTCVDADASALAAAKARGAEDTRVVDLESEAWHLGLERGPFDSVILADVLEHLRDPAKLLRSLREQSLLAEGAQIVVSVPNASHNAVIGSLLAGDFKYTETGILDETHVRWFSRSSLERLLEASGFRIVEVQRTLRTLEQTAAKGHVFDLSELEREMLHARGDAGQVIQWIVRAVPMGETASLGGHQLMVDSVREEFSQKLDSMVADLRSRLRELEPVSEEVRSLRQLLQDERAAARSDLEPAIDALQRERAHRRRLEKERAAILSSRSFRGARILSALSHPLRSARKVIARLKRSR